MWLLTRQKARHREEQRRLNSVPQQQRYLTETLSSPSAIWTLTSIKLPKTPEADFKRDANNPPCRGGHGSKTIRIKGYVVHIDMILHHEVTYKLTKDTIDTLTEHHKELYCVEAANDSGRPDREQRGRELHKGFVQAINKFILRTHVSALRGLKEGGTGKILEQRGDKVKETILSLMNLPCPRAVDAIQQNSVFPMDNVCSQFGMLSCQTAIELWKVPSSGSDVAQPTSTDDCLVRVPMAQCNPAPAPVSTQPYSTAHLSYYLPKETALISALSLSSMSAATHYGIGMAMAGIGDDYGYCPGQCQECAATHAFAITQMIASPQW